MTEFATANPKWPLRVGVAIVVAMVALVGAALGGSLWYAEREAAALIGQEQSQAAESELDLFVKVEQEEGEEGLIRAINRRVAVESGQTHKVYAFRADTGEILAGNLRSWPKDLGDDEAWGKVKAGVSPALHGATRALDDGGALLVGRDAADIDALRTRFLDAVWIAVSVVAITCLAIAIAVSAFLIARVQSLSDVAARVVEGDLSARSPGDRETGPFGQIARAQNTMLERIEHLVTGLTTVTDSLAHDLRTPLARTRRLLENASLAVDPTQKQQSVDAALAQTDKTIATFTSLIDIARAEGGLSRTAMETVDVADLANDVYDLFEPFAEERGVSFSLVPTQSAPIHGHRALLQQAIANLVDNAIKYAPSGGAVELSVTPQTSGVDVIVADNGSGIAPDQRADVIKRFRRGQGGAAEGLGLGLAIVEACARLHRGKLTLEDNEPGLRARLSLSAA